MSRRDPEAWGWFEAVVIAGVIAMAVLLVVASWDRPDGWTV